MNRFLIFLGFIILLITILLGLNFFLVKDIKMISKNLPYECGFEFNNAELTQELGAIHQTTIALLFGVTDLELITLFPYAVSPSRESSLGSFLIYLSIVTFGFIYEIGQNTIHIPTMQTLNKK